MALEPADRRPGDRQVVRAARRSRSLGDDTASRATSCAACSANASCTPPLEVISSKGHPNTTVADIVASAGVSREVFYSHFPSRTEAYPPDASAGVRAADGDNGGRILRHGRAMDRAGLAGRERHRLGLPWRRRALRTSRSSNRTPSARASRRARTRRWSPSQCCWRTGSFDASGVRRAVPFDLRGDRRVGDGGRSGATFAQRRPEELTQLLPMTAYLVITPYIGAKGAASFVHSKLRERAADVG